MRRFILIQQGNTWHIAKQHPGKDPVYSIIATSRSESSARELLAALTLHHTSNHLKE